MPEIIADVVGGRKIFKRAASSVRRQTLKKQSGSGSRKKSASRVIPTKSAKQTSRSLSDIFTNISLHSCRVLFGYQHFVAVSRNLEGEIPVVDVVLSSHEQEIYPTASLDKNCIEFELQTDRNYYVDLKQTNLALKLKSVNVVITKLTIPQK